MKCKIDGCTNTDLATRTRLCRLHHNEYTREHYQKYKEQYKSRAKQRKKDLRDEVHDYKSSTPCVDCGKIYPYYVMDFDHLDGDDKVNNVATLLRQGGRAKVFAEIAKCDLVCSNCHRVRTHKRLSGILVP